MAQSEIDAIRGLLKTKARPVGWEERRKRIEEVCAVWPVAGDVELETVDVDGLKAEWSIVLGSDSSRVLLFFHGGGYCSGSIVSHRRMVTEAGRERQGPLPSSTGSPPSTPFRRPMTMR
jgi:monoterpene epsilon-lactone hydrolase